MPAKKKLPSTPQRKPAPKKTFLPHADDSSDDEMVQESVSIYNIEQSLESVLKDFKSIKGNSGFKKADPQKLRRSFFLQSLGAEILYSKQVNEKYYSKKKTLLSQSSVVDLKKDLTEIIEKSFCDYFKNLLKIRYEILFNLFEERLFETIKDFLIENKKNLNKAVEEMLHEDMLRKTILCIRYSAPKQPDQFFL